MFSMFLTYFGSLFACGGLIWYMFFKNKNMPKPSLDSSAISKYFTLFILVPSSFIPFLNTALALYLLYFVAKEALAKKTAS